MPRASSASPWRASSSWLLAARETQRVRYRFLFARVIPKSRAAHRGAERGAMYGDDAAVVRLLVRARQQQLVFAVCLKLIDFHFSLSSAVLDANDSDKH
jgi:hypothetical protein